MDTRILKNNWEREYDFLELAEQELASMVSAFTEKALLSASPVPGGKCNTIYKLDIEGFSEPLILRINNRQEGALRKEYDVFLRTKDIVPQPQFLFFDDSLQYYQLPFAITSYVQGMTFRDFIFTHPEDHDTIRDLARQAGEMLSRIHKLVFPVAGSFKKHLTVQPLAPQEEFFTYVYSALRVQSIVEYIGEDTAASLKQSLLQIKPDLPSVNSATLTHADYDPTNILVVEQDGCWQISAIMDWEFSLAANVYFDIGLMLRYAHKLPACYEEGFVEGLAADTKLVDNWRKVSSAIDLINLLDTIMDRPEDQTPEKTADIVELVRHTASFLREG